MFAIPPRSRIFIATAFSFGWLFLGGPNNAQALQSETAPQPIPDTYNGTCQYIPSLCGNCGIYWCATDQPSLPRDL